MTKRVFISYKHKREDKVILDAFINEHFKPLLGEGEDIAVWSDERIEASQDWEREIQDAIDSASVALLLVSPGFLSSEYIKEREVPPLLEAEKNGKVRITCLYLETSVVDDPDCWLNDITRLQGLNSLDEPVKSLEGNRRSELYAGAAKQLKAVLKRTERPRRTDGQYQLTVRLNLTGDQLTRSYYDNNGQITEMRCTWTVPTSQPDGEQLHEALFGPRDRDQSTLVLQNLFGSSPSTIPSHSLHPVRVRIQTDDPGLASLPWAKTSWENRPLVDDGWTFELINSSVDANDLSFADVKLRAPCPALMIAPQPPHNPDLRNQLHYRSFEERLDHAWKFREKLLRAASWADLKRILTATKPPIVYYYGMARSDGRALTLLFEDPNGGTDPRPLADLAGLWGNTPPKLLFLNLISDTPISLGASVALLSPKIPLIITQSTTGQQISQAQDTALEWFHALLEGEEYLDPVEALHRRGLPTAIVWTAFSGWRTFTLDKPPREQLAHLLLDRKLQRSQVHKAVNDLVRDHQRRVCCVFAYGAEGNLIERFTDQLREYLRRNAREIAHINRLPFPFLPKHSNFDQSEIEDEVKKGLGLAPSAPLGGLLAKKKPRNPPGRARPVLLLDWGVRGSTTADTQLSGEALEAWFAFCCERLCAECPPDLRLLSCLCLERPEETHDTIKQTVQALHKDYWSRAFHLERVEPLDNVEEDELMEFLSSDHSSFPEHENAVRDLPELIYRKTRGQFDETVQLLEQAERTGWFSLCDDLRRSVKPEVTGPIDKKKLL